jgi:hypothetical protein
MEQGRAKPTMDRPVFRARQQFGQPVHLGVGQTRDGLREGVGHIVSSADTGRQQFHGRLEELRRLGPQPQLQAPRPGGRRRPDQPPLGRLAQSAGFFGRQVTQLQSRLPISDCLRRQIHPSAANQVDAPDGFAPVGESAAAERLRIPFPKPEPLGNRAQVRGVTARRPIRAIDNDALEQLLVRRFVERDSGDLRQGKIGKPVFQRGSVVAHAAPGVLPQMPLTRRVISDQAAAERDTPVGTEGELRHGAAALRLSLRSQCAAGDGLVADCLTGRKRPIETALGGAALSEIIPELEINVCVG